MDGGPEPRGPDRPGRMGAGGAIAPVAVAGGQPHLGRWIALVVIAIALAIAKPWAGLEPPAARVVAPPPTASPTATPEPTPRQDTAGPLVAAFCTDPTRWLVASTEHWRDQAVRVWRALESGHRRGRPGRPDDPGRPGRVRGPRPARLVRPGGGAGPPGRSGIRRGVAADLGRGRAGAPGPGATARGAVGVRGDVRPGAGGRRGRWTLRGSKRGGQPDPSAPAAVWAPGQYVFHYQRAGDFDRWFAIDIEILPLVQH